jgi:WD40 repeat protein
VFALGVWDAATGEEIETIPGGDGEEGHSGMVSKFQLGADGATLATSSWDHSVGLWDFPSRKLLHVLHGHRGEVWSVALAHRGDFVVSGSKDGEVKIWPTEQQAPHDSIEGRWKPLRYSADSRYLAALNREGSISIFNLGSLEAVYSSDLSDAGPRFGRYAVSMSDDLAVLAEGLADGSVRLHRLEDETESTLVVSDQRVEFVALSPDAKTLVAGDWRNGLSWWDLDDPSEPIAKLPGSEAVFSGDGGTLATVTRDGYAIVFDTATRAERIRIHYGGQSAGSNFALSPDGRLLAMTHGFDDFENAISVWDTASGKRLGTMTGHKQGIWSVAFSPDSRTLASSSGDGTLRLWNVPSRRELLSINDAGTNLTDLLFAPNGQYLVGGTPPFLRPGMLKVIEAPPIDLAQEGAEHLR